MTAKGALARALTKTLEQGYVPLKGFKVVSFASVVREELSYVDFRVTKIGDTSGKVLTAQISINDILFNAEFAKLLWGDEASAYPLTSDLWDLGEFTGMYWQYHLQQMVVQPTIIGRLNYLGGTL